MDFTREQTAAWATLRAVASLDEIRQMILQDEEAGAPRGRVSLERIALRIAAASGSDDNMKVKLENVVTSKYDGDVWFLAPVELLDGEKIIMKEGDPGFMEKMVELGVLEDEYRTTIDYYSDNPDVYGDPDETLQVGKTTFDVEELADGAVSSHTNPVYVWAEI